MDNFIKIEINTPASEDAEIIIANLSEIEFYAFEQEENTLIAYIKEEDFDEEKLRNSIPASMHFERETIKDQNWNQEWESSLQPVIIDDFAAIRASFHEPQKNVKHELIITPKMSFGTGHHATTFLMVQLMEKINFQNKTVLDFGTGTGVLAILAEKLGASKVTAIDYDEWSIDNTLENIKANDCKNIFVEKRNNLDGIAPVEIIIANINLNVLTQSSPAIGQLLSSGSLLLTSGFLSKDEEAMERAFADQHFVKKTVLQKGDWLAVLFQKL